MASAIYPKFKEGLLDLLSGYDLNSGDVKVCLIDTGTYTYSSAHDFHNDLSGIVGTSGNLASKTIVNGLFDAADITISAVSGASIEAVVIWIDSGASATSPLVAFIDGLSLTPNGGDIQIQWNGSGIFQL